MTNNTPDYDNLYFDCKNCELEDEYCASGDCPNDTLTAKWKRGELPEGWYYLKVNEELANCPVISECVVDYNLGLPISYFYDFDVAKIEQVLAPVPSYAEWKASYNCMLENEVLRLKNAQLKELLKECRQYLPYGGQICLVSEATRRLSHLKSKIDEVLK